MCFFLKEPTSIFWKFGLAFLAKESEKNDDITVTNKKTKQVKLEKQVNVTDEKASETTTKSKTSKSKK